MLSKTKYQNSSRAGCLPSDYSLILNTNQIFNSPCANGLLFNYTFNFTADLNSITKNTNYSLQGQSNYESCKEDVNVLLPKTKCGFDKCSFDGVYQPPVDQSTFLVKKLNYFK
jgi:adenosinetriphosphatase